MLCSRDCVDDDQLPTTTWTRQCEHAGRLIGIAYAAVTGVFPVWRLGPEQLPDAGDVGGTATVSEETVVTDAVLALSDAALRNLGAKQMPDLDRKVSLFESSISSAT